MSKAEDDEIERISLLAASAQPASTWPPITMAGAQRQHIAEVITESIAEHQRALRGSKVFRDRQRIERVLAQLSKSLAMVTPVDRKLS